jgi:hypothetical protein
MRDLTIEEKELAALVRDRIKQLSSAQDEMLDALSFKLGINTDSEAYGWLMDALFNSQEGETFYSYCIDNIKIN